MLRLENTEFIYEPYPIGLARGVFEDNYYQQLVQTFPSKDNFVFMQSLGDKYSLSELNNTDIYHDYITSCQPWHNFYKWVKSKDFIDYIFKILKDSNIDLGIHNYSIGSVEGKSIEFQKTVMRFFEYFDKKSSLSKPGLSARFEFSMLPANGGHIKPHTDSPNKIITLVVPMINKGAWLHSWGGGTEVMRPRDITKNFNLLNKQLEFDEVETVKTFDFSPNQCLIFVKTFNSLHAVRPMKGDNSNFMRSTLTINIETKG
jgi:hypothetical protein